MPTNEEFTVLIRTEVGPFAVEVVRLNITKRLRADESYSPRHRVHITGSRDEFGEEPAFAATFASAVAASAERASFLNAQDALGEAGR
jgi:hypothetical protein